MANRYVLGLFLFTLLTEGAGYGQPLCDDQLKASAVITSYVNLIKLYIQKEPEQLEALSTAIAESKDFINPLAGQKTSQALLISAGIEKLRKSFSTNDWQATQAQISRLRTELLGQQETKAIAQQETSHILGQRVIRKIKAEKAYQAHPFTQDGRSFVFFTYPSHKLSLYEVKQDSLVFIKDFELLQMFEQPRVLVNQNHVYLFFHKSNFEGGNNVGSRISILEFKNLEFSTVIEEFKTQDRYAYDIHKVWVSGGQIYFSVKRSGKIGFFGRYRPAFKIFRLTQSLFSSESVVKLVRGFKETSLQHFDVVPFELNKKSYLAYGASYEYPDKESRFVVRQQTAMKRFKVVAELKWGVYAMTSYEVSGQRYFALSGRNTENNLAFAIYHFDGRHFQLIDEIETNDFSGQIHWLGEGHNFAFFDKTSAYQVELRNGKIFKTIPQEWRDPIPKFFTIRNRNFIFEKWFDSKAMIHKSKVHEVVGLNLVETNIEFDPEARIISVQPTDNSNETLLLSINKKFIKLLSLFTSTKAK